ncbi:hypothetical protein ERO13_A08G104200v2 [Gossypium hirsutum]|uniref:RNA-binding protein 38 isoform X1 n=1 Tax=Gossypium hirsutum TaxID=3635 RepID=A0A1U8NJW4_GOSHI|nr:RNA-binding protein 38 isoform X1 [Gossypium hirsutum]KAG4187608.1 hypothetical protein ERO13_A08G104200v2 [Gossypium hirsutum]
MSEAGQHKVGGGGGDQGNGTGFGDTTYTKIFVGGLAWETKTDTLKRYFEQFGEILEAVVINDKTTGRSKGYGFVTFKDVDSAMRACYNPFPVIDGRRANCNLASLGAQKNRLSSASHSVAGIEKFSPSAPAPPPRVMEPSVAATPAFYRQFIPQYAFPYSAYGYPGYTQNMSPMNYYNVFGGQAFSSHYSSSGASGSAGVYMGYFPFYPQHGHGHGHGHGQSNQSQHPKITHYPHLAQQYRPFGTLTLAASASAAPATSPGTTTSAQNSSA